MRPCLASKKSEFEVCGPYYRRSDKQKIAEAFQIRDSDGLVVPPWDYNVAPTTFQPVIRHTKETHERELVLMRWGLVPPFANALPYFHSSSPITARAQTLVKTAVWRVPFQRRRCRVPADGFYEWVRPESRPDDCPEW